MITTIRRGGPKRVLPPLLLLLLLCARLAAQDPASYLQRATEQFNASGFGAAGSSTQRGHLNVSDAYGSVSYAYPLASYSINGHPIRLDLNYCGSVLHTAYGNFVRYSSSNSIPRWTKFSYAKPAWLVGVNGFAIQTTVDLNQFHGNAIAWGQSPGKTYTGKDFTWTLDGFHVCNRMMDLYEDGASTPYGHFVDFIRLLRSDGSVLELRNSQPANTSRPDTSSKLYTGYYYNPQGNGHDYAYVEFNRYYLPRQIQFIKDEHCYVWPRTVHYFPGDGLEYVFNEFVAPYGIEDYTDIDRFSGIPLLVGYQKYYGGRSAGPTVFYLERIVGPNGTLAEFGRDGHYPSSPTIHEGRLPITTFDGVKITGSNDYHMVVQALGRTYTVYISRTDNDAKRPRNFVTAIADPDGRISRFEYENYTRTYLNFAFPMFGDTLALTDWRLKKVIEPDASYVLTYAGSTNSTVAFVSPSQPFNPLDVHNIISGVKKYSPSGTLLASDDYQIAFKTSSPPKILPDSTVHTITDNVSGNSKNLTSSFRNFPDAENVTALQGVYLALTKRIITDGHDTSTTYIRYGSSLDALNGNIPAAPNLFYPTASWSEMNGVRRSYATFDYTVDTVRRYGAELTRTQRFGLEVATTVVHLKRPDDTTQLLLNDTLRYLHLPLKDTTVSMFSDSLWDREASLVNYRSLVRAGSISGSWEEMALDTLVALPKSADISSYSYRIPPRIGLLSSSVIADAAGNVLRGRSGYFETSASFAHSRGERGSPLADTAVGRGGVRYLAGTVGYDHYWWNRNLPGALRDANGSVARALYDYRIPQLRNLDGTYRPALGSILRDNDSIVRTPFRDGLYFSYLFEQPAVHQALVRKYDPSGTLRIDTLSEFLHRTFYGRVAGAMGPNGWYMRNSFTRAGRPALTWLPLDFPRPDSSTVTTTTGVETLPVESGNWAITRTDTLFCNLGGIRRRGAMDTLAKSELAAEARETVSSVPDCSSGVDTTAYTAQYETVGTLELPISLDDAVDRATTLDSAYLHLYVVNLRGKCLTVSFDIPQFKFTRTVILNCETWSDQHIAKAAKGDGAGLQSFPVSTGAQRYMDVDLRAIRDSLIAMSPGQVLQVRMTMKTAGGLIQLDNQAADRRPQLVLRGTFNRVQEYVDSTRDYTVSTAYTDDSLLVSTLYKIDDIDHTTTILNPASLPDGSRRSLTKVYAGPGYRPVRTHYLIGDPLAPSRIDSVVSRYDGLGGIFSTTDEDGDTAAIRRDGLGRPRTLFNGDGTWSGGTYVVGTPATCGITDALQDFFGFCAAVVTTNENRVKVARYYDAFDRLRREVVDSSLDGPNLMTRYEYDILGRLSIVIGPRGDSTHYWYDDFGRIKYIKGPDVGTWSYAWDNAGHLRFTQSQAQSDRGALGFQEYDDLGRLTVVGEATIGEPSGGEGWEGETQGRVMRGSGSGARRARKETGSSLQVIADESIDLNRLTDRADPTILHDLGASGILTANATLWQTPLLPTPRATADSVAGIVDCTLMPNLQLGEGEPPIGPFLRHQARFYEPVVSSGATLDDFEQLAHYPHFVRTAVNYDSLPPAAGPVWGGFPAAARWNALAPKGVVRNGRGERVAIASREHGGEPYDYTVFSYDERGRVEAMLRYTENLGFDAVYYTWNSANVVTSVRVVDPLRMHTTWYGYDRNGRLDSVWALLSPVGSGLGIGSPVYLPPPARVSAPDITYSYTKSRRIDSLGYPPVGVVVDYAYDRRGWIDTVNVTRSGAPSFLELLDYDSTGQVTRQRWQRGGGAMIAHTYTYDSVGRLLSWNDGGTVTSYNYDNAGNRLATSDGTVTTTYTYPASGRSDRLDETADIQGGAITGRRTYTHDGDGAMTDRVRKNASNTVIGEDHLAYSYRQLVRRYLSGNPTSSGRLDWRYKYDPSGERLQRRLYAAPGGDSLGQVLPWKYYLLDGSGMQLAAYSGEQTVSPSCGDTGRRVYFYPTEYLSHGVGAGNVVTKVTPGNGIKSYLVPDHLGSARSMVSPSGPSVDVDYGPFGAVLATAGSAEPRRGYIRRERDFESGLRNFGVRQYDQETGRFLSVDPLWATDASESPYSYVGSNPLVLVDPWGFDGNDPDNPPPPDPNAPPVVVTAPFEIIPAILTFGPDPKEVAQFLASGMVGFVWGIMEDVSWGANRAPQGGGVGYNAGLMTGHTFTLVGSTIEFFGGAAIAAVGEPAVIAIPGGLVVSVYASQVAISAAKNMSEEMMYMHFSPDATEGGGGGGNNENAPGNNPQPQNDRLGFNQLNKQVERGQAPRTIERFDVGDTRYHEKPHVHFTDGSALNTDGTWKHGSKVLTNAERKFLLKNGWVLP